MTLREYTTNELIQELSNRDNFTIYGMKLNAIRQFHYQYLKAKGKLPVNEENIIEFFECKNNENLDNNCMLFK